MSEGRQPLDHPSEEPSDTEALLSPEDALDFLIVRIAREIASQTEGLQIGSEVISKDPNYGVIVRYDIVNIVINDGSFHPEDGRAGEIAEVRFKQIFYQRPNEGPKGVTIPLGL